MLRPESSHPTPISDWELGIAAVLLLIAIFLTTLLVAEPRLGSPVTDKGSCRAFLTGRQALSAACSVSLRK